MISRYTRPELGRLWTDEARMETWRQVEVAACEELPGLLGDGNGPTPADLEAIRGAAFTVEAVNERERLTDHDMAAFVDVLAASAGEAGRWIHFGLTSSDVLDTALALQLRAVGEVIVPGRERARRGAGRARARARGTHCAWAGPTECTPSPRRSGSSSPGFAFEAHRNAERLQRAFAQAAVGAISGAVGTYAATSPEFEARVLERLGLAREDVSTQVVARDRHAELAGSDRPGGRGPGAAGDRGPSPAAHGGARGPGAVPRRAEGLERDAAQAQPDQSEQISGLARVLRGNAQAALEDVALWHERDISHSSVERIILPDSHDPARLLPAAHDRARARHDRRLRADAREPRADPRRAVLPAVLLALVAAGMTRDDAYRIVQELAQRAWDEGVPLRELLAARRPRGRPGPRGDLRPTTTTSATPRRSSGRLDGIA